MAGQVELHLETQCLGLQRAQAAAGPPGRGDMLGQVADMPAGEDKGQGAVHLLGLRRAGRALQRLAGLDKPVGVVHPVGLLQLGQARLGHAEQRMALGAVQHLALAKQRLVVQGRLVAGEIADGQLQLILQQAPFQLGGHGGEQFDLHRLVAPAKAPDGLCHLLQHGRRQPLGQTDMQAAEQLVGHALGLVLEGVDGREQPPGRRQHLLALGRQAKAGLAALAQAKAQARLQLGHLRADAGLADAQLTLGRTEAAAFDHGDEQAQQLQVEVAQLAEHAGSIH